MKSISFREAFRVLETLFINVYTQFSEKQDTIVIYYSITIVIYKIHNAEKRGSTHRFYLPTSRPFCSANNIA